MASEDTKEDVVEYKKRKIHAALEMIFIHGLTTDFIVRTTTQDSRDVYERTFRRILKRSTDSLEDIEIGH